MLALALALSRVVPVASQHANCNDLTIDGVPWEDASGYDCAVRPRLLYLGDGRVHDCDNDAIPLFEFLLIVLIIVCALCAGLRLLVVSDGGYRRACGRLVRAVWRRGLW